MMRCCDGYILDLFKIIKCVMQEYIVKFTKDLRNNLSSYMLLDLLSYFAPGPGVRKKFSSTQLGIKLLLLMLINVKMSTIVGILTIMSRIFLKHQHNILGLSDPEKNPAFSYISILMSI